MGHVRKYLLSQKDFNQLICAPLRQGFGNAINENKILDFMSYLRLRSRSLDRNPASEPCISNAEYVDVRMRTDGKADEQQYHSNVSII